MSLTRSVINELCGYIQEKSSAVLGNKFWDCRVVTGIDYGTKPDKYEARILAISKFRMFVVHGKTPASIKVDRCFHLLSIRSIQVINTSEMSIVLDESIGSKRRLYIRSELAARDLVLHILTAIKHYFPDTNSTISGILELNPSEILSEYKNLPSSKPALACHNFRRSYAALCDFYDQPFREEVVWDVEKIYASHRLHVLRLDDFTHLLPRDLVPILAVCQYSSYFTGVCVDGVKLSSDLVEVILNIVRRSHWLTSLVLRNCSLPRDFVSMFAAAVGNNTSIPLETLDLSKNTLDDKKGFASLSGMMSKLPNLHTVILAECMLPEKCVNLVASGLLQALKPSTGPQQSHLVSIDFSGNALKDEMNDLQQLISICTSLRSINLSDTGFNIDKLWSSLKFGGLQLETLKLAGCQSSRRSKDSVQNVKEYFSTAVALKHINLSYTSMCPDLLKALLLGLASNQQLKPFTLIMDGVCDRGCATVFETCIGGVDASSLSLRDNSLEADALSIISASSQMPHLKRLDLSGTNFVNLRRSAKHASTLNNILLELVKLIGEEDSQLSELILSDCRLSSHLSVLLNTLGVASSLQLLDITGNEMGNFGARLLGKALQINVSLKSILLDRNQITGDGFTDIAHSLKLNSTLVSMPYPLIDVADSLNRPDRAKTLLALGEVETCLEKNRRGEERGEAHYRQAVSNLQQEFMSKSDGGDRLAELCDRLGTSLETVVKDWPGEDGSMLGLIDEAIFNLEQSSTSSAMEALTPLRQVAEMEGLDMRMPVVETSSTTRATLATSIADYLCSRRWKTVNSAVESVVSDWRVQYNNTSSSEDKRSISSWQNKSDASSPVVTQSGSFGRSNHKPSHRPKSVVTDLCNGGEISDSKLSFDVPPSGSQLSHVLKSRPKPPRSVNRTKAVLQQHGFKRAMQESMESGTSSTTREFEDHAALYDIAADEPSSSPDLLGSSLDSIAQTGAGLVDKPSSRSAMLPPSSSSSPPTGVTIQQNEQKIPPPLPTTQPPVMNGPNAMAAASSPRSTAPIARSYSPILGRSTSPAPPPIIPRRNRVGPAMTPPSLPPKPDSVPVSVTIRPASCAVEDENANSRRSVADMARMFSSSETPFVRKT